MDSTEHALVFNPSVLTLIPKVSRLILLDQWRASTPTRIVPFDDENSTGMLESSDTGLAVACG